MKMNQSTFDFSAPPPIAQTRADQIFNAFAAFHRANPEIWRLFQKYTFHVIGTGLKNYSSDAIVQRIRWEAEIETRGGDGVKINDHYRAYYARLFEAKYPEHSGFFRNRKRTSEQRDAMENDEQVFIGAKAGREPGLGSRLQDLLAEDNS